jgi:hypothetical protein
VDQNKKIRTSHTESEEGEVESMESKARGWLLRGAKGRRKRKNESGLSK